MYRLIALLLLLFLFACAKNPIDSGDQPKATGKITIVCIASPSKAAKPAAEIITVRAEITVLVGSHPKTYALKKGTDTETTFETPDGGVDADAGSNYVIVTGYDSENRTSWFGAASCTVSSSGPPSEVSVTLYDTNTVPSTVSIPAGSFLMGQVGIIEPVHFVTLSAFEMSVYETTQGQYNAITGSNPSYFAEDRVNPYDPDNWGEPYDPNWWTQNLPVEQMTWFEAIHYCNLLSVTAGLTPCYYWAGEWKCDYTKNGFRLPTEAEWEYACRGGRQYEYGTNDGNISPGQANYDGGEYAKTVAVGSYPKNPYGLYDMSGNVWEKCNDWFGSYSSDAQDNPTGPASGEYKVVRGGAWGWSEFWCRSVVQVSGFSPSNRDYRIGFRVVRRAQ